MAAYRVRYRGTAGTSCPGIDGALRGQGDRHVFCLSASIELLAEVLTDTLSHQVTLALVLSILVIVWYRDYRRSNQHRWFDDDDFWDR